MSDRDQFCHHCGVSNDLHSGPDTCANAEAKADMLTLFFGGMR